MELKSTKKTQLSRFQFIALTTAVASIFVIIAWLFSSRQPTTEEAPQETAKKPSVVVEKPDSSSSTVLPQEALPQNNQLVYPVTTKPEFQQSQELQFIVNEVIGQIKAKKLSTSFVSITLIDVNSGEIAGDKQEQLRYPASVTKLFWMVALYGFSQANSVPKIKSFYPDLDLMMVKSDNEASSRLLDAITKTKSGSELSKGEYKNWFDRRNAVSLFFQQAGYKDININQKTYPIPSENLYEPKGRELQIRGNLKNPIRNKISTDQAARLMYEIVTGQAISPEYSQDMQRWLLRDLRPEAWQDIDPNTGNFNPVRTFFGESLPTDVLFLSKAGWTSKTRQEVAYVKTKDGKTAYILAIFAEHPSYAQNWQIFPHISRQVYNRMTALTR